jgi:flagellin
MAITINTNTTATIASLNLNKSNGMLRNSLNRLSSGKQIVNSSDDAGGLAVSMKLTAALKRGEGVNKNLGNAISFMQTQDGALSTTANILERMSELRTLADDVTKNTSDIANYNTEFLQLRSQLGNIASEKFNGISLFTGSGVTFQGNSGNASTQLKVYTTEAGSTSGVTISVTKSTLLAALNIKGTATGASGANEVDNLADFTTTDTSTSASLTAFTVNDITEAIQNVATLRAENGAYTSRLQFAQQQLQTNNANIESANSRIIDVDVASESTKFARYNILVQSGSAMLSQANGLSAIALNLLG